MTGRFRLFALGFFLLTAAAPLCAAPIEVSGVVLDTRGKGLAGATAELLPKLSVLATGSTLLDGKTGPPPAATAVSDAEGRFRLNAPEPGMWIVRVRAEAFMPRELSLSPLLEETALPAVRMTVASRLRVEVLDSQGRPRAGSLVIANAVPDLDRPSPRIWDPWQEAQGMAFTGADGSVSLPVEASSLLVSAGADGHLVTRQKSERQAKIEIRLTRGCDFAVEVLDREKRPVPGALVGNEGISGRTDAAGKLTVTLPCGREARVAAWLPDGRQTETRLPAKRVQGETVRLILPPQPARLTGRALEEGTSQPVAGAFVWASADPGLAVRTDSAGHYTLTVPVGQPLYLQAEAQGSLPAIVQRGAVTGPGSQEGPTFSLPPSILASGTVVNEAGRPVTGAELQATGNGRMLWAVPSQTRSGPQGKFRLRLASGQPHQLTARHSSYAPASVQVPATAPHASRTDLRIVLKRGLSAVGTVRDEKENPVAGARVRLTSALDERSPDPLAFLRGEAEPPETTSGADGRFTFEHLLAGRFDLRAQAAGFGPVEVPGLEIKESPRPVSLGTVILHPGLTLTGTVVDPQNRPVAGAKVQAGAGPFSSMFGRMEEPPWETSTGPDGRFALADLSAGQRLQMEVSREGYASRALSGIELPSQPLRVVLSPGGRIAGRVVDEEGKAVTPAFIEVGKGGSAPMMGGRALLLGGRHEPVDESGEFEVRDLEPGTLTLRASAEGYRPSERTGLELAAGAELTGVEMVLRKGATVVGQVFGPDGKPVPGADVELTESGAFSFSRERATTDGEGRYRIEGVEPGPRAFAASHEDFPRSVRDLDVQPGENRLDFRLSGGYPVSGRVADAADQPVEGAELSLFSDSISGYKHTLSGADGSFRFENVSAGSYSLGASRDGYAQARQAEMEVRGPVSGLEVRLTRGGAIRGRILGVTLPDLKNLHVMASPSSNAGRGIQSGQADFQGQYRIDNVASGEWKVVAALPQSGRRAEGKVVVEEGTEAVLDLDLTEEGGLTLSGRVTRRGEPAGNVRIIAEGTDQKEGGTAISNYDGLFRITGLAAGTYQISSVVWASLSHHQTVTLSSDQEIAIELPDSRITGRVVDAADSSPVEGATVTVQAAGGEPDPRSAFLRSGTSSDSAGNFTLTDVGEGSFKVTARKEGYSPAETTVETGGGSAVDGLRLALNATQGLTLQVLTPAGGSPARLDAALLGPNGAALLTGSYPVTEGGRSRISEAPPGRWTLLASGGGATASLEVTVPGPPVQIVVPPATTLRVTVPDLAGSSVLAKATALGANGQPYRWLRYGGFLGSEWSMADGQVLLNNLPAGTWRIVVTAPDGHTWQGTATTSPGVEAAVVLR